MPSRRVSSVLKGIVQVVSLKSRDKGCGWRIMRGRLISQSYRKLK